MSLSDQQHRLRLDLRGCDSDMRGLNPNTSLYKKLAEKRKKIILELEQLGAERTKV